jgi:hypothetical protein
VIVELLSPCWNFISCCNRAVVRHVDSNWIVGLEVGQLVM